MEAPKTIPQAVVPADQSPPWGQDRPEPSAALTASARLDRPVEAVHWSIVALTSLTALSILFGAYGNASQPRELLPIVIDAR